MPRRCRSWPTRSPPPRRCWMPSGPAGRCPRRPSRPSSGASASSSMPGSASSPSSPRCGPSPGSGTRSAASATASQDARHRRFRYGVQVNSLGLTEQQPENNVYRILLEMLAVTLSKGRSRPGGAAPGLERGAGPAAALGPAMVAADAADPRPMRPTFSSTSDLLDGSHVIEAKVEELAAAAREELARIEAMGGALAAVESGYMKAAPGREQHQTCCGDRLRGSAGGRRQCLHRQRTVASHRRRRWRLHGRRPGGGGRADRPARGASGSPRRHAPPRPRWRALGEAAREGRNIMEPSIACARSGVTTGEWADALRRVFGEYRAPTGVGAARATADELLAPVRAAVERRLAPAGSATEDPGRQARPRRPFERCRADRRGGARLRHRGGLRRHPPDPGAHRQHRARGGRSSRRPLDPLRLPLGPCRGRAGAHAPSSAWRVPVVVGGIVPPADARGPASPPASPASTRPRTMRCTRSWRISCASPRPPGSRRPEPAALGSLLAARARAVTAARPRA